MFFSGYTLTFIISEEDSTSKIGIKGQAEEEESSLQLVVMWFVVM